MPIGYYNYVIGGRLNTKEREREKKERHTHKISRWIVPIETIHAEMMKRHPRQSLWWIRIQASWYRRPVVCCSSMNASFSFQSVRSYLSIPVCWNQYSNCLSSVKYWTKREQETGVRTKLNDAHQRILDRLHKRSFIVQFNSMCEVYGKVKKLKLP